MLVTVVEDHIDELVSGLKDVDVSYQHLTHAKSWASQCNQHHDITNITMSPTSRCHQNHCSL